MESRIAEALARPFAPEQIKNREGPRGIRLDYIEAHAVITRLNDALGGDWSFEVAEHHIFDNEVVVVGKLTVHAEPELVKTAVGCQDIKRYANGDPVSLGNDLKAAASDALKKCSTLLGVGLHLHDKDARWSARNGHQSHSGNGKNGVNRHSFARGSNGAGVQRRKAGRSNGNGRANGNGHRVREPGAPLTLKQMKYIYSAARTQGIDGDAVAALVNEMFGKSKVDYLSKQEASNLIDRLKQ